MMQPGRHERLAWTVSLLALVLIVGTVSLATLHPRFPAPRVPPPESLEPGKPLLIELRLRWRDPVAPPTWEMVFEDAPAPRHWNGYPVRELEQRRLRAFLVRTESQYLVLLERDPHLGCRIKWLAEGDRFLNPCHGEQYTAEGVYLIGPQPRGMDRIRVVRRDGGWFLDLGCLRPGPQPEQTEPGPCLRAIPGPMTRREGIR